MSIVEISIEDYKQEFETSKNKEKLGEVNTDFQFIHPFKTSKQRHKWQMLLVCFILLFQPKIGNLNKNVGGLL